MATKLRKRPYKCYVVEEDGQHRKIFLCNVDATTPTFASRAADRKHASFMRSLVCGKYHIEATELPAT